MNVEHELKVIPVDESLPATLQELAQAGWQLIPGVTPVAIYHFWRPTMDPAKASVAGSKMTLKIDDSKVHVVGPDGQIKQ